MWRKRKRPVIWNAVACDEIMNVMKFQYVHIAHTYITIILLYDNNLVNGKKSAVL